MLSITTQGLERARARANEKIRRYVPDDEQRAALVQACETAIVSATRSVWAASRVVVTRLLEDGTVRPADQSFATLIAPSVANEYAKEHADERLASAGGAP